MDIIINLLLRLRDVYSFSSGSKFNIYKSRKKYMEPSLKNMLYERDYILIFLNFMLDLIDNIWSGYKKKDVKTSLNSTSQPFSLRKQMNCETLFKDFISDVLNYMKD